MQCCSSCLFCAGLLSCHALWGGQARHFPPRKTECFGFAFILAFGVWRWRVGCYDLRCNNSDKNRSAGLLTIPHHYQEWH